MTDPTPETLAALLHHISDTAEAPWKPDDPDSVSECNAMWLSWIEHELIELGVHLGAWKVDRKCIEALVKAICRELCTCGPADEPDTSKHDALSCRYHALVAALRGEEEK